MLEELEQTPFTQKDQTKLKKLRPYTQRRLKQLSQIPKLPRFIHFERLSSDNNLLKNFAPTKLRLKNLSTLNDISSKKLKTTFKSPKKIFFEKNY